MAGSLTRMSVSPVWLRWPSCKALSSASRSVSSSSAIISSASCCFCSGVRAAISWSISSGVGSSAERKDFRAICFSQAGACFQPNRLSASAATATAAEIAKCFSSWAGPLLPPPPEPKRPFGSRA